MALWKFTRRSPSCVACGHEFADGEVHFSRLQVHPEELLREDICRACWPAQQAEAETEVESEDGAPAPHPGSTLVWWRATRRIQETKRMQVDMEGLERVFLLLEGREEEHLEELRYLLCLLLVRKRRLMLGRALVQGDREYLVVRRPRRQEELRVRVFDFQPERMEELRDDLERLFEGEGLSDGAGSEEGEQAAAEDAQAEEPRDVAGDADGDPAAEGTVTDSAVTDSAVTEGVDSPATSAS